MTDQKPLPNLFVQTYENDKTPGPVPYRNYCHVNKENVDSFCRGRTLGENEKLSAAALYIPASRIEALVEKLKNESVETIYEARSLARCCDELEQLLKGEND